jgi:hypothetical protein
MKNKIFIFLIFIPTIAYSAVVELDGDGVGIETLMGGVGVARLGSLGSILSNPSLLAWLPKKAEFISANRVDFYKSQNSAGAEVIVNPSIVPISAISGNRMNDWAHAFGVVSGEQKITASGISDGKTFTVDEESQEISLAYGLGKKITSSLGVGASLSLTRSSNENFSRLFGEVGGYKFLSSMKVNEYIWSMSSSIGTAYAYKSWSFGLSTGFNILSFGHVVSKNEYTYSSATGEISSGTSHDDKDTYNFVGFTQVGLQKVIGRNRLFIDVQTFPGYKNSDGNEVSTGYTYKLGLESLVFETGFKIYSGIGLTPEQKIKNEENEKEAHFYSLGLSKSGKHSQNFLGVAYARSAGEEYSVKRLILGTKFEY